MFDLNIGISVCLAVLPIYFVYFYHLRWKIKARKQFGDLIVERLLKCFKTKPVTKLVLNLLGIHQSLSPVLITDRHQTRRSKEGVDIIILIFLTPWRRISPCLERSKQAISSLLTNWKRQNRHGRFAGRLMFNYQHQICCSKIVPFYN